MPAPTALMPRQAVPSLDLPLVGGGRFVLNQDKPENFTLVVFYRGYHCPICSMYLGELSKLKDKFAEKGVSIIAVSSDTAERAETAKQEWNLSNIDIAYGLDLDKAREWGLYISTSRGKTSTGVLEPDQFSEPGVFLVRPDGTLYYGAVQTMPFARPAFRDLVGALDFALANDYPARGEVVDHGSKAA
ncbi:MAG: peroxiredoxin-like family protein [Pseudomonadota bacterium]